MRPSMHPPTCRTRTSRQSCEQVANLVVDITPLHAHPFEMLAQKLRVAHLHVEYLLAQSPDRNQQLDGERVVRCLAPVEEFLQAATSRALARRCVALLHVVYDPLQNADCFAAR